MGIVTNMTTLRHRVIMYFLNCLMLRACLQIIAALASIHSPRMQCIYVYAAQLGKLLGTVILSALADQYVPGHHFNGLQTKIRAMKLHALKVFAVNAKEERATRFLLARIMKRWAKLTVVHVHLRRLSRQLIEISHNMLKRRTLILLRKYVKGMKVRPVLGSTTPCDVKCVVRQ